MRSSRANHQAFGQNPHYQWTYQSQERLAAWLYVFFLIFGLGLCLCLCSSFDLLFAFSPTIPEEPVVWKVHVICVDGYSCQWDLADPMPQSLYVFR